MNTFFSNKCYNFNNHFKFLLNTISVLFSSPHENNPAERTFPKKGYKYNARWGRTEILIVFTLSQFAASKHVSKGVI